MVLLGPPRTCEFLDLKISPRNNTHTTKLMVKEETCDRPRSMVLTPSWLSHRISNLNGTGSAGGGGGIDC
jgi:hypothetical protein